MRYIYQKTGPALKASPALKKIPTAKGNHFSQKSSILIWLENGNSITGMDALRLFNCWALAQRIAELRSEGHVIIANVVKTPSGKRIARYSLVKTIIP
jgi:hypothetical protein